jgi:hypothetical protein
MRSTRFLIAAIVGWSLACGFFESAEAPHFTEKAPLTDPWQALPLPLDGATVTFSDSETCTIHHGGKAIPELGTGYKAALEAGGWSLDRDDSIDQLINQTWTKGDDILSLAILDQDGEHVATLAIVPF